MLKEKKDWQALLLSMSDPLIPYFSKEGARLDLGKTGVYYDHRAVSMEGISRLLWGFVPYYAGGGKDPEWNLRLAKALAAGTDPEGEEYWGGFSDKDQKFVEMAAIAYGLLFAKKSFWETRLFCLLIRIFIFLLQSIIIVWYMLRYAGMRIRNGHRCIKNGRWSLRSSLYTGLMKAERHLLSEDL